MKEPFSKRKFIDSVSNFWTVKGSEGMPWDEYLSYVVEYSENYKPVYKPEIPEEDKHSFEGFKWVEIKELPELSKIDADNLMNGVVYGTYNRLRK